MTWSPPLLVVWEDRLSHRSTIPQSPQAVTTSTLTRVQVARLPSPSVAELTITLLTTCFLLDANSRGIMFLLVPAGATSTALII